MQPRPDIHRAAHLLCRAALLWVTVLSGAITTGCGGAEDDAPSGPADGYWVGDEVSFTLRDGHVEDLQVHKANCTDDDGCTFEYGGGVDGRWLGVPSVAIKSGAYDIQGQFANRYQIAGAIVMADAKACCKVVGAWAAAHKAPLPTPGVDGGSTDSGGGGVGPTDWNGHSMGDLHPGPSQGVAPSAGSEQLSAEQQAAHLALSQVRAAIGAGAIAQDAALAKAAQAHSEFYVAHAQKYKATKLSPHAEDASFGAGFTGVQANERVAKAGFSGPPGAEVMAFTGTADGAVRGWMATVYHRLPLVSPTGEHFGYGAAKQGNNACETMNFSARGPRNQDPIVVYPWPGQSDVDTSWSGNEGPQPPPPPGGYPSGPVITARVPGVTAWGPHTLEDKDGNLIKHVFLDSTNDPNMQKFDRLSMAMYSNEPLIAGETYTVRVTITVGAKEQTLAWRFTTK